MSLLDEPRATVMTPAVPTAVAVIRPIVRIASSACLGILRDEDQEQVARVHAAIAAAPYGHAELASSTVDLDAKPTMILHLLERPVEGT